MAVDAASVVVISTVETVLLVEVTVGVAAVALTMEVSVETTVVTAPAMETVDVEVTVARLV